MRKVIFFVLLLAVFLLALVTDWNVVQTSRTARIDALPPEVTPDDVLEVIIGAPEKAQERAGPATPGGRPAPEPAAGARGETTPPVSPARGGARPETRHVYEVQSGDTLSSISEKLYGDRSMMQKLIEWNLLENPDLIVPGQRLRYYK